MNRPVKRAGPVIASCLSCPWSMTGNTWRPIRRQLREHTARKHRGIAA